MEHKLKIGITHGDINGVGYEVILKTLSDRSRDSRLAGRAYRCYRYSTDQQTHHTVGQIRLPGTYRIL